MAGENVIPYKVKQGDDLYTLAQRFFGVSERWLDIAIFNNLDPPYIVLYKDIQGSQKAEGEVTFTRASSPISDIIIPAGTIIATEEKEYFGSFENGTSRAFQFVFQIAENVTLTTGQVRVSANAIALDTGPDYNVAPGEISVILDDVLVAAPNELTVSNENAFVSGEIRNVVSPGDLIFIPLGINRTSHTYRDFTEGVTSSTDWADQILGTDAYLINPFSQSVSNINQVTNDITAGANNDLRTLVGIDNLAQAVTHRLSTPRGALKGHPNYGSLLPEMVGGAGALSTPAVMSIEAKNVLLQEPRIKNVLSILVVKEDGGVYRIYAEAEAIGQENNVKLNIVFPQAVTATV